MLANWTDLTWPDFRQIDFERAVAVMPVAAIEQHGPHLPVSVDSDLNAGVIAAAAAFVPDDLPVYLLPQLAIGKSNEHSAFPGTLTVGATTLIALWTEVAESVLRAGFRRIVLFNSHGGQPQIADVVARDLRVRFGALVVVANSYGLGTPDGLFGDDELEFGIHGGDIETSMMLHLRPEAVRTGLAGTFPSAGQAIAQKYEVLRLEGAVGIGWMTQDVNPTGAIGDAAIATAEKGAQAVDYAARRLARLLGEVSAFPLLDQELRP
ncbi:putative creatinine amidohydrolase [Caenibius tardaugens NBRC 16725]|uniref:Putative creatinine amidohydrolase n=1 Tax=Caenibius tardaugens NBRC 16725 TaxID=1219035 RepID=U2YPZ8_9SPHN|nr:creatininase family protein [Caenibius tardaugens]AZI35339.1 creatininase family protein [Caenibius tardaugens NBRC 16725]GAD51020.1 putative creatinine amidohydrolase [Caenibius tardaugens NBRC 16725]